MRKSSPRTQEATQLDDLGFRARLLLLKAAIMVLLVVATL